MRDVDLPEDTIVVRTWLDGKSLHDIPAGYFCGHCREEMSLSWGKECPVCGRSMDRILRSQPWPEAV